MIPHLVSTTIKYLSHAKFTYSFDSLIGERRASCSSGCLSNQLIRPIYLDADWSIVIETRSMLRHDHMIDNFSFGRTTVNKVTKVANLQNFEQLLDILIWIT